MARSTVAEYVVALEEAGWLDRTVRPWDVTIGLPTCRLRDSIPDEVRQQLIIRDGYIRRACGATTDLTVDHVHPWSKGGTDDLDNLQLLCRPCNSRKGARD
ncbi:HNH endonuclease [Micromonospora costi]|uniref:HNH endonuclease n=2 Tax=Micromonospora costi TaxID=1530042 RepID=A0A3B0A7Q4_9ACTN|nr:HNH endonuclease [Micromonospora costi]